MSPAKIPLQATQVNHDPPKPGDLIKLKESSPRDLANKLVKPLIFLLDGEALNNISDDVYHHQIVAKDSYVTLVPGDVVMVIHFFKRPQYIRYVSHEKNSTNKPTTMRTTKKYISTNVPLPTRPTSLLPKELKGYIAYVLHNEKLWATDVFSSLEEFLSSYEVIANNA
jgi:hypothetical protein